MLFYFPFFQITVVELYYFVKFGRRLLKTEKKINDSSRKRLNKEYFYSVLFKQDNISKLKMIKTFDKNMIAYDSVVRVHISLQAQTKYHKC